MVCGVENFHLRKISGLGIGPFNSFHGGRRDDATHSIWGKSLERQAGVPRVKAKRQMKKKGKEENKVMPDISTVLIRQQGL